MNKIEKLGAESDAVNKAAPTDEAISKQAQNIAEKMSAEMALETQHQALETQHQLNLGEFDAAAMIAQIEAEIGYEANMHLGAQVPLPGYGGDLQGMAAVPEHASAEEQHR